MFRRVKAFLYNLDALIAIAVQDFLEAWIAADQEAR